MVLLAAEGLAGREIAERVGCSEPTVIRWRCRFAEHGVAGLADEPRSGKPPTIPRAVRDEILSITLTEPPTELVPTVAGPPRGSVGSPGSVTDAPPGWLRRPDQPDQRHVRASNRGPRREQMIWRDIAWSTVV